jgi:hypothetical protein
MASNVVAAYGMFREQVALCDVLKTLNRAGFHNEKICMLFSPVHSVAHRVKEANVLSADRHASAVTAELIGWLSEFGAVVIPTVGFFIRSREFFPAIIVEKDSKGRCGSARTLEGLGFPERDAARFERDLRSAGVLVYVSCPEVKANWALELLRLTGAEEIGALGMEREEATLPLPVQFRPADAGHQLTV